MYVCATVLAAGFVTDAFGIHVLFGAFLIAKEDPFASAILDKVDEDLVSGILLVLRLKQLEDYGGHY